MSASPRIHWRKSRKSAENGSCVEVAAVVGQIALRDSKYPKGGTLTIDDSEWPTMLERLKAEIT